MPRPDPDTPSLDPAELAAVATSLNLSLSELDRQRLLAYLALLQRWNTTYNLTAVRDPSQMLVQHIADCLAIVPSVRRHCATDSLRLLDVGSGGGLPGVVLAVACPQLNVTCVDTVGKKAAFVRQVAAELGLQNLRSEHTRVEQLGGQFDIVASRAFSALADFCRLTRSCVADRGVWVAMKGKVPNEEIAGLPKDIEVFHVEQLTVPRLDAERCLVWMRVAT
jgi:16S rRNA (guanine527-N7)-methyltransferase